MHCITTSYYICTKEKPMNYSEVTVLFSILELFFFTSAAVVSVAITALGHL